MIKTRIRTLLLLLTLIPVFLFGQETKKITDKETHEEYYVLKSDNSIKQGKYYKNHNNGLGRIDGYYRNGVKDGIWEFYDFNGDLQQKFDFTKNELIFNKVSGKAKELIYKVINDSDAPETLLDRLPIYIGADAILVQILRQNIHYPRAAMEKGTQGKVYISFTIDKNGKTSNRRLSRGIGDGCDEEALKAVKAIPDNWLPGLIKGQPVNVEITVPVSFTLN